MNTIKDFLEKFHDKLILAHPSQKPLDHPNVIYTDKMNEGFLQACDVDEEINTVKEYEDWLIRKGYIRRITNGI